MKKWKIIAIFLGFLILFLFVYPVLAGDPQDSLEQNSQSLNEELAACKEDLSLLQQQLQEMNQTLENITRERDYYKALYENTTVNVTNLELIQIKQNITVLNQQIQQLNVSISNIEQRIESIEESLLIKVAGLHISIDKLIGITLLGTLIDVIFHFKDKKNNKNEGEALKKNDKKTRSSEKA